MREQNEQKGPSWWDIRQATVEIERAHHVKVLCTATLVAPDNGPWHHWWTVEARVGGVAANCQVRVRKADRFPSAKHATLPGLLYRLLLEIDAAMVNEELSAERQAHF